MLSRDPQQWNGTAPAGVLVIFPSFQLSNNGSLCTTRSDSASPVPLIQPQQGRKTPRCIYGGLEPATIHLYLPTFSNSCPPKGHSPPSVLHQLGPPDCALLASSAVVLEADYVVPSPSPLCGQPAEPTTLLYHSNIYQEFLPLQTAIRSRFPVITAANWGNQKKLTCIQYFLYRNVECDFTYQNLKSATLQHQFLCILQAEKTAHGHPQTHKILSLQFYILLKPQ